MELNDNCWIYPIFFSSTIPLIARNIELYNPENIECMPRHYPQPGNLHRTISFTHRFSVSFETYLQEKY